MFGDELVSAEYQESMAMQRQGIDRIVKLRDGTVLKIDEKVDMYVRPTIFLEFWSSWEDQREGWFYTSKSDYTVYTFPNGEAYWLHMPSLRELWNQNRSEWMKTYGKNGKPHDIRNSFTRNGKHVSYTGKGIGIPKEHLMEHIDPYAKKNNAPLWKLVCDYKTTRLPEQLAMAIAEITHADKQENQRDTSVNKGGIATG